MTVAEIEKEADKFVKEDNPIIDKYMDKFFGDLKLTEKQAYAMIGLCKICFSMGMIEMQKRLSLS